MERTDPSFDVGQMINGFRAAVQPGQSDDQQPSPRAPSSRCRVTSRPGGPEIDQTSKLTNAFAGQDNELGDVITNLNSMVGKFGPAQRRSRPRHHPDPRDGVDVQRAAPELVDSMGSIKRVVNQLATISDNVYPSLNEMIQSPARLLIASASRSNRSSPSPAPTSRCCSRHWRG